MLVVFLMLGLLIALFFACAGLTYFAESVIQPQSERPARSDSAR